MLPKTAKSISMIPLISAILLLVASIAGCSSPPEKPPETITREEAIPGGAEDPDPIGSPLPTESISREESIPAGAEKLNPTVDPLPPILHHSDWLDPVPMPGPINTAGSEDSPFITPDGTGLLFFFTPDSSIPAEQQLDDAVTGIYYTSRSSTQAEWAQPIFLPLADPGESALNGCPTLHGQTLWFCSARSGGFRPVDFYTADFAHSSASGWQNAGQELNQRIGIGELHLTADGRSIYFHADLPGGAGGYDIWVTHQQGEGWSTPENITAVNTAEMEGWPWLNSGGDNSAGDELWFTRTYQGSPAVFRSVLNGANWSEPELIVSQFAGEPTLDAEGNLYFVHHFIRDGIILDADIYVAYRKLP